MSKCVKDIVVLNNPHYSSGGLSQVAHKLSPGMLLFHMHRDPTAVTVQHRVRAALLADTCKPQVTTAPADLHSHAVELTLLSV